VVGGPWSEAALGRSVRAVADWAMRQEMPPFDPERQGQWAGSIRRFGGDERARLIAQATNNALRSFRWQRVYDLAEARGYRPAVVERAVQLLR
jgi:hypothetical protein